MKFICGGLIFCLFVGIILFIKGIQDSGFMMWFVGVVLMAIGSFGMHRAHLTDQELHSEIEKRTGIFKP